MAKGRLHISREKIALLIFFVFIAAAAFFACSYFLIGKQLNTTATVVDEATGNMQDYSLVVFSGTASLRNADAETEAASSKGEDAYAASLGQDAASALRSKLLEAYVAAKIEGTLAKERVFVSEVRDDYELKGADVATIDIGDMKRYSKPAIIDSGKRKFGIFSARSYVSRAKLKSNIESLRGQGADNIICIVANPQMLSSYNGIDAVICLSPLNEEDGNSPIGPTLVIENPKEGDVGVMLFSDTNAISYKVVKTL